jgi:hypothetical protein
MRVTGGRPGGLLLVFGVASLAAVAVGAFISASSGVASASWIRNLAAWGVGAGAGIGLATAFHPRFLSLFLSAMPLGLAAALISPDQSGVHRWVDVGPLHVNMALLLLPAGVVALSALARDARWPWLAVLASLAVLVAQPDASQATTLAIAAALVAIALVRQLALRSALVAVLGILAALAWLRPDPLQPVAEVEGIIGLAWSVSPVAAVAAIALLAAIGAAPAALTLTSPTTAGVAGFGLSACFAVWAIAPLLGAFPVPFVGIGMSAILGAWLGVGLLVGLLVHGDGRQGE